MIYSLASQIGATGVASVGSQTALSFYPGFFSSGSVESVNSYLLPSASGANAVSVTFTGGASGVGSLSLALAPNAGGGIAWVNRERRFINKRG